MVGHSRQMDGVASLAYTPTIHIFGIWLKEDVDGRTTRGHDGG
ncbi:MAG TPA: hypothetical protein VN769_09650 [Xanthobacteraceae bacterium]|nr:hypothetical protein [Xanthobacteraceae bacterium]